MPVLHRHFVFAILKILRRYFLYERKLLADTQSFVIQIIDSGVPFDILAVKEPDVTAKIADRRTRHFFCETFNGRLRI